MKTVLDLNSISDYRKFIKIKALPVFRFCGREAWYPDEYAHLVEGKKKRSSVAAKIEPHPHCLQKSRQVDRLSYHERLR